MTMLLSSVASNATRVPIARGIDDLGQVALEAANRRARDDRGGTFARCGASAICVGRGRSLAPPPGPSLLPNRTPYPADALPTRAWNGRPGSGGARGTTEISE